VKPAISKDVPTGELQARLAAMADSVDDAIIGKCWRGWRSASSAVPPGKWSGEQSCGSFIYFPLLKPTRAGNKIRALNLIK